MGEGRLMSNRIRYLAAISAEPARLAHYYVRYFGMRILAQSEEGDLSLTDGYFNLTCFKLRPGLRELEPRMGIGLNHIGLQVDNIEAVKERYFSFNPKGIIPAEPGGPHYVSLPIHDPGFMPIIPPSSSVRVHE